MNNVNYNVTKTTATVIDIQRHNLCYLIEVFELALFFLEEFEGNKPISCT